VKTGRIVDLSVISSAARPAKHVDVETFPGDRREEEGPDITVKVGYLRDEEAAWTKKGKKSHYGYRAHMATDSKDCFIV
jgi:IS5 family transposase